MLKDTIHIRDRVDLVGGLCGLPCLGYWIVTPFLGFVFWYQSVALMIGLAFFAALSGFIVTTRISWKTVPVHQVKQVAGNLAVRASLMTILLGGSMFTLASTLSRRELGVFSFIFVTPRDVLVVTALSIFPSIFMGVVASKFVASFKIEPTVIGNEVPDSGQSESKKVEDLDWRPLPAIFVVALSAYTSPFWLPPKKTVLVMPKEVPAPAPIVEVEKEPDVTLAPEEIKEVFQFEKPEDLAEADVSRWNIGSTWTISGVDDDSPIAISPDGTTLAYCSQSFGTHQVILVDVYRQEEIHPFNVYGRVTQMAWSPKGDKLFFVSGNQCAVIEIESEDLTLLPIPREGDIPKGIAWWWDKTEILFSGNDKIILDLENLQLKGIEKSPHFTGLDAAQWQGWLERKKDHMANTESFELQVLPWVNSYTVPNRLLGREKWSFKTGGSHLCVIDKDIATRHRLQDIHYDRRSRYLSSEDGVIIIRVSNDQAICYYVELEVSPTKRLLEVDVGMTRDRQSESMETTAAIDGKAISVFITAAVVNPLNGQRVAPDGERVKARGRLVAWEGSQARIWIEDVFLRIEAGDVIGDPHYWNGKSPGPIDHPFGDGWFAVLENLIYVEEDYVLLRQDLEEMAARREVVDSLRGNPGEAIEAFVRRHHRNATLRKLDQFVMDYAPSKVDYFTNGLVDRHFILREHQAYQEKWQRIVEIVKEPIQVRRLGNGRYSVRYDMDFKQSKADGSWASGTSAITLVIQSAEGGLRIISQKAEVRNARKGKS